MVLSTWCCATFPTARRPVSGMWSFRLTNCGSNTKAVIDLADEIQKWQEKNGEASVSPYQSESFGGYSYSKATDAETGGAVTWQSAFKRQLSAWRKI